MYYANKHSIGPFEAWSDSIQNYCVHHEKRFQDLMSGKAGNITTLALNQDRNLTLQEITWPAFSVWG
jgi:hypothetical protein